MSRTGVSKVWVIIHHPDQDNYGADPKVYGPYGVHVEAIQTRAAIEAANPGDRVQLHRLTPYRS